MKNKKLFNMIFVVWVIFGTTNAQSPSDYPTRVPGNCNNITMFDCGNGNCIPFQLVRNCVQDCPNGEDEQCGISQTLCDVSIGSGCGKCVATVDAPVLCLDQRYVRLCEQGISVTDGSPIFKCAGTQNCIPFDWINDGTNDCGDFSDEDPCMGGYNCTTVRISSSTTLSNCTCKNLFKGNGTVWRANDPLFKLRVPGSCLNNPLQFDCGNGACIDINLVRNCRADCSNGIDEACWDGSVLCSDGCTCVPSALNGTCPSLSTTLNSIPLTSTTSRLTTPLITTTTTSIATTPTTTRTTTAAQTTGIATTTTSRITTTTAAVQTTGIQINTTVTAQTTRISTTTAQTTEIAITSTAAATTTILPATTTTSSSSTRLPTGISSSQQTTVATTNVTTSRSSVSSASSTNFMSTTSTKGQNPSFCGITSFQCSNGQCVSDAQVLDGKLDCSDGSDENCPISCSGNQSCLYVTIYHNFSCSCPANTIRTNDFLCLPKTNQPVDCADLAVLAINNKINFTSGEYFVYKINCTANDRTCLIKCNCDMSTDGGGYTIFQQRQSADGDFFRSWADYKDGFRISSTDYWQGNDFLSSVTNRAGVTYELIILLTTSNGSVVKVNYDKIKIGKESEKYKLTLGSLVGSTGDNLYASRNRDFATFDNEPTTSTVKHCPTYWLSGWWLDINCADVGNLNLPLVASPRYPQLNGVDWPVQGRKLNVTSSSIQIRPTWYRQTVLTSTISVTPKTGFSGSNYVFANGCLIMVLIVFFIFANDSTISRV